MSRLNIAPTKSNQINVKRDLAMAAEGFNLLEQKREILVMELMRMLDRVRAVQKDVEARRQAAYDVLRKAIARNGYHRMRSIGAGIHYEHSVTVATHVVAGVRTPQIDVQTGEFTSQYGFAGSDSLVDSTTVEFLELLNAIGRLAELETSVWLLARELRKTQRRVNALEQNFIPDFEDTLHYISESLESKDLESFSMMKMVKRNAEAKRKARAESTG